VNLPKPQTSAQRKQLFGSFKFAHDPRPGNPEHVRILGGWDTSNLVSIDVPQLQRLGQRRVTVHRGAAKAVLRLLAAWELADLLPLLHTFNGSYAARFKRQNGTLAERVAKCAKLGEQSLSNHAWASALDFNAPELPLGRALPPGHPYEQLVPIANEAGWFWGGHFRIRPDPMHWELVRP
jgi:hypothetical protein